MYGIPTRETKRKRNWGYPNHPINFQPQFFLFPNQPFFSLFSFTGAPSGPQAFFEPVFFPFLISLRLAQQQHWPRVINQAKIEDAAAIHMKANICFPMRPSMLSCSTDVMAFCMIMKRTVAMTVATVVKRAARKVRMVMRRVSQRV
jgi:hypothetical protein